MQSRNSCYQIPNSPEFNPDDFVIDGTKTPENAFIFENPRPAPISPAPPPPIFDDIIADLDDDMDFESNDPIAVELDGFIAAPPADDQPEMFSDEFARLSDDEIRAIFGIARKQPEISHSRKHPKVEKEIKAACAIRDQLREKYIFVEDTSVNYNSSAGRAKDRLRTAIFVEDAAKILGVDATRLSNGRVGGRPVLFRSEIQSAADIALARDAKFRRVSERVRVDFLCQPSRITPQSYGLVVIRLNNTTVQEHAIIAVRPGHRSDLAIGMQKIIDRCSDDVAIVHEYQTNSYYDIICVLIIQYVAVASVDHDGFAVPIVYACDSLANIAANISRIDRE